MEENQARTHNYCLKASWNIKMQKMTSIETERTW